ncbi:hypothetical protein DFR75_107166 [Nocardia ignorata]|uniref:Uncharacterized protein n=1 Tax=Nocardia ignorata TaxID=145285 RepID=A0A4R6P327_NOCIG|nr:hypothetical protein DFR75_107166 [Nocardia ignorata]
MAIQDNRRRTRNLRLAAVTFAIGFGVHGLDHLRRGMDASPMSIMIGGNVQAVLVAVAVLMTMTYRYRAPEAAIGIGFGSAAVFTYAHLLPTFWADYQDSYISLPHTNVTWFSWLSAITEIGTGLVYGFVGVGVLRARKSTDPSARLDASPGTNR